RAEKADGIRSAFGAHGGEARGRVLEGLFPACGHELAAAANHRLVQPLWVIREVESEATLYAQEIAVEAGEIAVICADDLLIAHAERRLAPIRAMRANGRHILHLPRARVVTVGTAGERADGADVDAIAAFHALQVIFVIGNNHGKRPALADAERLDAH